jgi:hypothetical protein
VDDLYLADAFDLLAYWKDFPPVHVALAGLVKGLNGGSPAMPTTVSTPDAVQSFVEQFKR